MKDKKGCPSLKSGETFLPVKQNLSPLKVHGEGFLFISSIHPSLTHSSTLVWWVVFFIFFLSPDILHVFSVAIGDRFRLAGKDIVEI